MLYLDTSVFVIWNFSVEINFQNLKKKIVSIQNKALRLITNNFDFNLHNTFSLYEQLSIFKLSDIHKHKVASFIYKFSGKLTPETFTNYFVKTDSVHSTNTRHYFDGNFCIPRYITS